jgi:glycosyltransferase involved in cell wall biosynthesis
MPFAPPLVTVVTPVYNGEKYLGEAIESVLGQTYANWELVVLDNASTDSTPAIAARYREADPRLRLHRNERTVPYIENWNRAVRLMHPDSAYCKILHADDRLHADCLERMVQLAEEQPSVGIVGSWVDRGGDIGCRWDEAPGNVVDGRELGRLWLTRAIPDVFGSPTTLLLRASIVREREQLYPYVEHALVDQQLCLDLLRSHDFGYLREALSFTRLHPDSITSAEESRNPRYAGKLAILAAHGPAFLDEGEYRAVEDYWLSKYYAFLARQALQFRGPRFWAYHRRLFRQIGRRMDLRELGARVIHRLKRKIQGQAGSA